MVVEIKKTVLIKALLAVAFIALLSNSAFSADQIDTNRNPAHIDIYVTPFYNSEGPTVCCAGRFSDALESTNEDTFVAAVREMKRNWQTLNFLQMYIAAIRLYDLGYRKESVYWFYSAQYRGRLFDSLLDEKKIGKLGDPGFELQHANDAFFELAGPYFNSYASGDIDGLSEILQRVVRENQKMPDIKNTYYDLSIFRDESDWPTRNRAMGEGLEKYRVSLKEQKDEIKRKRIESGAETQFSKLEDKKFPDYSASEAAAVERHLANLRKLEKSGTFEDAEKEQQALVKIGYFERKTFEFKLRPVTTNNFSEFMHRLTNFTFIYDRYTFVTTNQTITVTTHRADMPTWKKAISEFDSGKKN